MATKNNTLLDESVLKDLKMIMEDEFAEVLQVFLDESVGLMSEIHQAFQEEPENVARKIHALKSCSDNVGAVSLAEAAEEIRQHLINNDFDTAKGKLDELQDLFTQSHAQVKKCMKDNIDKVA